MMFDADTLHKAVTGKQHFALMNTMHRLLLKIQFNISLERLRSALELSRHPLIGFHSTSKVRPIGCFSIAQR